MRGRSDQLVHPRDGLDLATDGLQQRARGLAAVDAALHALPAFLHRLAGLLALQLQAADDALDFVGRLGSPTCEAAHLVGHHREASALVAGARRFDSGVERQQVGLRSDGTDDVEHAADLRNFGDQALHPLIGPFDVLGEPADLAQRRAHRRTAFSGAAGGIRGRLGGVIGMLGNVIDGQAHLLHGLGHLRGLGQLAGRAAAQGGGGLAQLSGRGAYLARVGKRRMQQLPKLDEQTIEAFGDQAAPAVTHAQIEALRIACDAGDSRHQGIALGRLTCGAQRQVDENGALDHDIHRVQSDHAPAASWYQINRRAPLLQGEERQMMHGDGGRRDDDGQPVPVINEKGQQHEDAEVHFKQAVRQVDV